MSVSICTVAAIGAVFVVSVRLSFIGKLSPRSVGFQKVQVSISS